MWIKINEDDRHAVWVDQPTKKNEKEDIKKFAKLLSNDLLRRMRRNPSRKKIRIVILPYPDEN